MNKGYITLLLTIIITSILLITTSVIGFSSVSNRLNIAATENKIQSRQLAQACLYIAIKNLALDLTNTNAQQKDFSNTENCKVGTIIYLDKNVFQITTSGIVGKYSSKLQANYNTSALTINNLEVLN